MGFSTDNILITSNSIHIIPDGFVAGATNFVAATHQTSSLTVTANDDNLHAPTAGTSSYIIISASAPPSSLQELEQDSAGADHYAIVYWTSYNCNHISRIKTAGNSSSLTSSYGSLAGSSFILHHPSASGTISERVHHPAYSQSIEVWYSLPPVYTYATSSVITFPDDGMSSSQAPAPSGSQFQFVLSGSNGQVFTFVPTGSAQEFIEEHNQQSGSARNFQYLFKHVHHNVTASLYGDINNPSGSSGIDDGPILTPVSVSLARLSDVINIDKDLIGVSATASGNTIQFTATESGYYRPALAFITSSLITQTTLATFTLGGGQNLTSSRPPYTTTWQAEIPITISASAHAVATQTSQVLNSRSGSFISASVSGSAATIYGLIIENKYSGSVPIISGSSSPIFTYEVLKSGSFTVEPEYLYAADSAIPVYIENGDNVSTMVTKSVNAINQFYSGFVGPVLSASFSGSTHFQIEHEMPNFASPPVSYDIARGMSASIVTSGSARITSVEGILHHSASTGELRLDPDDGSSFMLSGSGNQLLYMSGSGDKIGFNTKDPIKELDFRADEMQFSRKSEQKGMRITKDGDMESFNFDAASSATGSELIMSYQAGGAGALTQAQAGATVQDIGLMTSAEFIDISDTFHGGDVTATLKGTFRESDVLKIISHAQQLGFFGQASIGDNIGTIRWAVQSGSGDSDIRGAGEAATIKGIVSGVNDDTGGVTAKLDFNIAKTTGNPATKLFSIDPSVGIVCSSSLVLATGNSLHLGSAAADGVDRRIDFRHATAPFSVGVDDSRNVFAIHSANTFNNSGTNEFEISSIGLASFKYSLGVGTVLTVGTNLTVGGYGRIDGLRVGTTSTSPGDGNLYIEDDIVHVANITASGNISASGTMTAISASIDKLHVTDTNIVGQRHILFNSPIYINDNPLLVDNGYFGSSLANTPANWNDPTAASFDSSAGTFEDVIDITEDEHGSKTFFAPFPVSRIEVLSSWRTAGTGDEEKFWCGIWTGSAGVRLGVTSSAHNTVKNIGFVTGSIHEWFTGGDWNGHNNDIDFTFETPLPPFTQIYYGMGTGETSDVGTKNIRGYITMMVYEA